MIKTFGSNIVSAFTGGVPVKAIYAYGEKVWPTSTPSPSNNEIFYTSTDGQVVTPSTTKIPSGLNIVSNTYTPGVGGLIVFDDDISSVWMYMFSNKQTLRTVVLPDSITIIKEQAFNQCENLISVNIPNGVNTIEREAFRKCGIHNITIPASTTSLDESAFKWTPLETISVDSGNQVYDSRNNCNAVIDTSTNTLVIGASNTIIPSSVVKIGYCAFFGRTNLTSISIPSSVTEIQEQGFYCSGLTQISLPGVTILRSGAFAGCTNLVDVSVPALLYLGYPYNSMGVFEDCTSLVSITLPSRLQLIYNMAFNGCTNLSEVIINATTPPQLGYNAFDNTSPSLLIKVPSGSLQAYKVASEWSNYESQIVANINVSDTIDFSTLGLVNNTEYYSFTFGDSTISFNGGTTLAKYYSSDSTMRVYNSGQIIIQSTNTISEIEFTWSGTQSTYKPDNDYASPSGYSTTTEKWTGSSNSVVMQRPSVSGTWRLKAVTVNYS